MGQGINNSRLKRYLKKEGILRAGYTTLRSSVIVCKTCPGATKKKKRSSTGARPVGRPTPRPV